MFKNDYIKLYVDTIRSSLKMIDRSDRPFVVSSPSNGKQSEDQGYIAKNPYDKKWGDGEKMIIYSFSTSLKKLVSSSFL